MRLTCTINGERREVDGLWEGESLLHVLRERLGLPGAKNACEQGECGSCSVYLDGQLVCSCLVLAGQAEGPRDPHRGGAGRRRRAASGAGGLPGGGSGAVRLLHARPDRRDARSARSQRGADGSGDPRGAGRQPVPLHGYEKILDAVRLAAEASR
jgi:carbon-monoxide dehydrogenase small subunit